MVIVGGTCKDCNHWQDSGGKYGVCDMFSESSDLACTDWGPLMTEPSFGCVCWEGVLTVECEDE